MNCLNCGSQQIYRKNPQEKVVYCDSCGYSWEVKQAKKPLLQTKVYMSRGPMKGNQKEITPQEATQELQDFLSTLAAQLQTLSRIQFQE